MKFTSALLLKLAAANGFVVVLLGAFGAHALKAIVPESSLGTWQTAVLYHMFHVAALLAGCVATRLLGTTSLLYWSNLCFCAGIFLFSGSLYLLVLTKATWLGMITPLGGVCLLLGWALLLKAVMSYKHE